MAWYGLSGKTYQLNSVPMSSGGEGDVYMVLPTGNQLAKVYHADTIARSPELEKKLTVMVKHPPSSSVLSQVAWPLDVLYNQNHVFCGFIMPKLNITDELLELYKYPAQKHKNITVKQKIIVAENICAVISEVHKAGYVFGDFNPRNIGINMNNGTVAFLDTDSYHIFDRATGAQYKCKVCLDGYVAPETIVNCKKYNGKDVYAQAAFHETFTEETDNFALAIHIFKLLMNGYTPFNGIKETDSASQASPGVGNIAIERNNYCFKFGNKPQSPAVPSKGALPKEIIELFNRAFVSGRANPQSRPSAAEWQAALVRYENSLKTCIVNPTHFYLKSLKDCPWCEADLLYRRAIAAPITQKHFGPSPVVMPPQQTYTPARGSAPQTQPAAVYQSVARTTTNSEFPVVAVLILGMFSSAAFYYSIQNSEFMRWFYSFLDFLQYSLSSGNSSLQSSMTAETFLLMLLKMCVPIFIFLPVLAAGFAIARKVQDFTKSQLALKLINGMPFIWLLCLQGSFLLTACQLYPQMSSDPFGNIAGLIYLAILISLPILFLIPVTIFAVIYRVVLAILKIRGDTIWGVISSYASNIFIIYVVTSFVSFGAYACGWVYSELSGEKIYYSVFAIHAILSLILLGINLIYHGLSQSKNRIVAELGSAYLLSVVGSVLIGLLVLGIEWILTSALNASSLDSAPATQNMNLYQVALFVSFIILFGRSLYQKIRIKP